MFTLLTDKNGYKNHVSHLVGLGRSVEGSSGEGKRSQFLDATRCRRWSIFGRTFVLIGVGPSNEKEDEELSMDAIGQMFAGRFCSFFSLSRRVWVVQLKRMSLSDWLTDISVVLASVVV